MKYAIASGKGGTGKTTVSASLASIWKNPIIAMDLDVEEPKRDPGAEKERGHVRQPERHGWMSGKAV